MRVRLVMLLVGSLAANGLGIVALAPAATAAAPATAPAVVSPIGDTVSANPVLNWTAVSGAAKYRVEISASQSFSSILMQQDTVSLHYAPSQDLPLGDLFWRVAATDGGSGVGPYSDAAQFTKTWSAAPSPVAPSDGATLTFPTDPALFSWDPLPGASTYTLQIDDASDFVGAAEYKTPNTSFTLVEPQTVDQAYFWRVRAQSATTGVVSQWSAARQYTYRWLSTPTLTPPPADNNGAVTDVQLSWSRIDGAKTYEVQISPNGDWANNVTVDATVKSTAYSPATSLLNGSYFWRVRAMDAASPQHLGAWSDTGEASPNTFDRKWPAQPQLLTPAWDPANPDVVPHVNSALDLTWTPVDHAAYYEIQVSTDVNFSPTTVWECYTNHTEYTPYTRIYPTGSAGEPDTCQFASPPSPYWVSGRTYYWRVRGIDAPAGVLGLWSSTAGGPYRFVRDPQQPDYLSPSEGDSVSTPTLRWSAVPGVEKYLVTILNSANSPVVNAVSTYATSYTPTVSALNPSDGPFSWYVQTVDAEKVTSAPPSSLYYNHFSLVAQTAGNALTLVAPADQAENVQMPSMSWTPVTGATKYFVHVASNGIEQVIASNVPYPAFTYAGLPLAPDTYDWWVEARDAQGHTLGLSDHRTFTVLSPGLLLGASDYLLPAGCTPQHLCADTPTLKWNPAPNAAAYVVSIANDPNFTNVVRSYTTAYTTLTPRESLLDNQAGQAYYWFVRPCLDAGLTRCGPGADDTTVNSRAGTFQKHSTPVELVSPDDHTTSTGQITFQWADYLATGGAASPSASQEAKQYRIQVSTVADFATTLDSAVVDGTTYTPTTVTYPNGPLYWRVQAIDGSANTLTWSPISLVTKQSAQPVTYAPTNGRLVTGVPYLAWRPADFAAQYTVEIYKNGDTLFSPGNLVLTQSTKFTAWAPTTGLPQGDYAWRVQARDADNRPGPWSAPVMFHLDADDPGLIAPAPGYTAQSSDMLFAWTAVLGAAQYRWQLSTSAGFSTLTSSQSTVMTQWSPTGAIGDGSYYWRVQALDASGNVLSTSTPNRIYKDSTAPTVTALTPTSSAPVSGPFTATFSEPVEGISVASFRVSAVGASKGVSGVVSTPTPTTATWTPSAPLVAGETYTVSLTSAITDLATNPLVPKSMTVRTSTTVENTSPVFTERWDQDTAISASGGSYDASKTRGSAATFTFTGTTVALIGTRAPTGGYAAVYLDGHLQTSALSFYSSGTKYRQTLWTKSGLGATTHTLQLRPLGTKSSKATDSWVYLDAFKVGTVVYEQTSSAVRETFARVMTSSASGGSYDLATHATGGDNGTRPSFTATVKGTGVTVWGMRGTTGGKAAIYVDNVLRATVDLYSTTSYRSTLYSSPALTNKIHTVRIEVVGTRTGGRSGVGIDCLTAV